MQTRVRVWGHAHPSSRLKQLWRRESGKRAICLVQYISVGILLGFVGVVHRVLKQTRSPEGTAETASCFG